jgi:hypothetical protein
VGLWIEPAPVRARGTSRLHDPSHPYVEGVWLPVLGPASYVAWRRLLGPLFFGLILVSRRGRIKR